MYKHGYIGVTACDTKNAHNQDSSITNITGAAQLTDIRGESDGKLFPNDRGVATRGLNDEECPYEGTRIRPCDPSDQPTNPPPREYTIRVHTPTVTVSAIKDRETPVISDISWEFQSLLAGIQTEIEYALRDVKIDDIPLGGGHENKFSPLPIFNMDLIGRFETDVNGGKINVAITLYNLYLNATIQSTKWYTSDADVEATIGQVIVKERFDIATGRFENFQIDLKDLDVDISRGFPLGDIETVFDLIEIVFGGKNFVDNEVEENIKKEVKAIYRDINPNAFIAENIGELSDLNFGPIDGIPTEKLLPIIAEGLRDFDISAGLYVVTPESSPRRAGQLQLTINTDALNHAKNIYFANN